jgi:hypothetical protein
MIFRHQNLELNIILDKVKIKQVESAKFLGLLIDPKLSWKAHIKSVENQIAKNLRVLQQTKNKLDTNSKLLLYHSLILSHMSYCNEIWGNTFGSYLKKIKQQQKKAIRLVFNQGFSTPTNVLFRDNNLLKFPDLVNINICSLGFSAFKGKLPLILQSKFLNIADIHKYKTRQNMKFYIPNNNKNNTYKSIIKCCQHEFNNLPDIFKEFPSVKRFKTKLKQSLIETY